ncbi:MAG: hypothetical protein ACO3A4_07835 [Silvanigrellaceae bacterium]
MMRRSIEFSFLWVVVGCSLAACKPTSTSGCLSVSSSASSIEPGKTSSFIQGGYVRLGDKLCTATFDIVDVGETEIRLKAYSARHCRFESATSNARNSVSLYFDQTTQRSAGYVSNLPAEESFSTRATKIVADVGTLNIPLATSLFRDALDVPVQYDPWGGKPLSGESSIVCNNFDIAPAIADPARNLSQSCWSYLDLGTFDLRLKRDSISAKDFKFVSEQLKKKQFNLSEHLKANPALAANSSEIKKEVDGVVGLLRLQRSAQLAYLLSMDLCKVSSDSGFDSGKFCSAQKRMIEIAGQNFVETDENGEAVNIFDKLSRIGDPGFPGLSYSRLLAGERLALGSNPLDYPSASMLAKEFAQSLREIYSNRSFITVGKIRSAVKAASGTSPEERLSPAFVLGTNFVTSDLTGRQQIQYLQFPLTSIGEKSSNFILSPVSGNPGTSVGDVFGVSRYGILRFALQKQSELISFFPSDSGSLISLGGVVPLFALNTVNDQPTSGGASILALPEASEELVSSRPGATIANNGNASGQAKIKPGMSTAGRCY